MKTTNLPSLPILNQNRACDGCKACCYTHVVNTPTLEGMKNVTPFFRHCRYESRNGCQIYSNRPKECKTYTCAWLQGRLELDQRPDKTGLVIDYATLETHGIDFVSVMTAWPGAHKAKHAKRMIRRLAETQCVAVIDVNDAYVVGPSGKTEEIDVLTEYLDMFRTLIS